MNILAENLQAKKYLEIGVNYGATFRNVNAAYKVGVDPKFRFEIADLRSESVVFFEGTSDEFFSQTTGCKFDLIFIDGLHIFEQALRDFTNSFSLSHEKTVWVIDDTIPSDVYSSLRSYAKAVKFRGLSGSDERSWHGDVYKVVMFIHDYLPSFNYATIKENGNPQTLVWKERRKEFLPLFSTLKKITDMDYFDFIEHVEVMKVMAESAALDKCIDAVKQN
jgi:hypothetical protein